MFSFHLNKRCKHDEDWIENALEVLVAVILSLKEHPYWNEEGFPEALSIHDFSHLEKPDPAAFFGKLPVNEFRNRPAVQGLKKAVEQWIKWVAGLKIILRLPG